MAAAAPGRDAVSPLRQAYQGKLNVKAAPSWPWARPPILMPGRAGPRKKKCVKKVHRESKTKNYVKDVDQIHDELAKESSDPSRKRERPVDPDLPGLGQYYCAETDRHFISQDALDAHMRSKAFKKRRKELEKEPFSQLEAELAAGKGMPDKGYG